VLPQCDIDTPEARAHRCLQRPFQRKLCLGDTLERLIGKRCADALMRAGSGFDFVPFDIRADGV
jgi:hypothetical protein